MLWTSWTLTLIASMQLSSVTDAAQPACHSEQVDMMFITIGGMEFIDCPSKGLLGENIVWIDLSHSTKDSILCISPCCKPLWKASLHRCQEPSPPWEEIRIRDKIPGKTNLKFPHAFTCLLQWKMLWASSCQRARTYILWKILHSFDPQDLSINWLHVSHLIIRI